MVPSLILFHSSKVTVPIFEKEITSIHIKSY